MTPRHLDFGTVTETCYAVPGRNGKRALQTCMCCQMRQVSSLPVSTLFMREEPPLLPLDYTVVLLWERFMQLHVAVGAYFADFASSK